MAATFRSEVTGMPPYAWAAGAASAVSRVVSWRKISSRLIPICCRPTSAWPPADDGPAPAPRARRGPTRTRPRRPGRRRATPRPCTARTPGTARSVAASAPSSPRASTRRTPAPEQPAGQVLGRVLGDHPALVDDHHPAAGHRDLGQDVGREHDRVAAGERADQLAGLDDLLRVEAGRRLVEDQHVGVVQDRLGEADALPVALRQLVDQRRLHVADPALLDRVVDARLALGLRGTPLMRAQKSR